MQIHQIKPKIKKSAKKRIGRGGKRGGYSGRGIKGQKSRAGRKIRPEIRDVIKKLPKKRGYRFASFREKPVVVKLDVLENKFNDNDKITPAILLKKGIIKKQKGKLPAIKLLDGKITKKFLISNVKISKKAAEKIIKAGGSYVE